MRLVSLFSGCGGLDLGFAKAGFDVEWANEVDSNIWETYQRNHPDTYLEKRGILKVPSSEIPSSLGIIGGPPCQSWSSGGAKRGIQDRRGRLFLEYVRVISDKSPLFFVAENVNGILAPRHKEALDQIIDSLKGAGQFGYNVSINLVNAHDYNVPQSRKRVFIVGFRADLGLEFQFPEKSEIRPSVACIKDLQDSALNSPSGVTNGDLCSIPNHEYHNGGFSYIFMSRNRVLSWNNPSFTIPASLRQVPLHPSCPPMVKVDTDVMEFSSNSEYRRLSVRECARIQNFPDDFIFHYTNVNHGYKMVGNAVPVNLSLAVATQIRKQLAAAGAIPTQENQAELMEVL